LEDTDDNAADFEAIRFSDYVTKTGGAFDDPQDPAKLANFEKYRPKNHAHGEWDPFAP
jgi:hypothetical protein